MPSTTTSIHGGQASSAGALTFVFGIVAAALATVPAIESTVARNSTLVFALLVGGFTLVRLNSSTPSGGLGRTALLTLAVLATLAAISISFGLVASLSSPLWVIPPAAFALLAVWGLTRAAYR